MTFTELFTTYLAIGAPFGTYYFFKHRSKVSSIALFVNSIGVVLLWFLFAARLLRLRHHVLNYLLFRTHWNFSLESKIKETSQNLLNIFAQVSKTTGILTYFEFRETLERFIGLTLASQQSSANSPIAKHESEIFRIVGHEQRALRLAEKISHRKNYLRLQLHQSFARQDFLRVCQDLKKISIESNEEFKIWQLYQIQVIRLLNLLKDEEATQAFWNLRESPFIALHGHAPKENLKRDSRAILSPRPINKTFPITVSSHGFTSGTQD